MSKIRKVKLNSLYGQMANATMKTKEKMDLCAKWARKTACVFCLHYNECIKRGEPVSEYGRFWADFLENRFPKLAAFKRERCHGLGNLRVVHAYEFEGAPLALSYAPLGKYFRVPVYLDTTDDELEAWLFYTYAKATSSVLRNERKK